MTGDRGGYSEVVSWLELTQQERPPKDVLWYLLEQAMGVWPGAGPPDRITVIAEWDGDDDG